jgi:hypothetical protein
MALVGEMHRVAFLIEHEVERVLEVAELLLLGRQLAIRDVLELHLLDLPPSPPTR